MIWYTSPILWSSLLGWFIAQLIKMVHMLIKQKKIDYKLLFSTGRMPSAHTSMVCSLATSVGLVQGFGSPLFTVAAVFAAITMFDAQSVRKAAGEQAVILNKIVDEVMQHHKLSKGRLSELLGHTRTEVFAGMLLGIAIAVVYNLI